MTDVGLTPRLAYARVMHTAPEHTVSCPALLCVSVTAKETTFCDVQKVRVCLLCA